MSQVARDWISDAAREIHESSAANASFERIRAIIVRHCPLEPDTAYVKAVTFTPSEERLLSVAAVGASSETHALLGLIERLAGVTIIPADERR